MTDGELKAHLTARARRFSADARRYRDDAIRVSDPQEEDALYRAAKQCEAWALALDNAAVALGLPASISASRAWLAICPPQTHAEAQENAANPHADTEEK